MSYRCDILTKRSKSWKLRLFEINSDSISMFNRNDERNYICKMNFKTC